MGKFVLLVMCFLFLLPLPAWCNDLFIQSQTAPVFNKPSLAGTKVTVLEQGTKVTSLKKEGMWQQIKFNRQSGWVYTLMLGKTPPTPSVKVTSEDVKQMAVTARKRPSSYASTAAARGLMHQRKRLGQDIGYDYEALKKMESYAATPKDTIQFLKERDSQ